MRFTRCRSLQLLTCQFRQGADVAAAKLATPKRKAPKCSNCGEIGHRNLVSQCPIRKGEPKKAKRRL